MESVEMEVEHVVVGSRANGDAGVLAADLVPAQSIRSGPL